LQELFQKQRIEFLHGKMKPAEKDEIMSKFAAGKIDILVSTTVVEVGVNVPNATVMVVEDAENYGLAQLHQLRGRVGRGQDQSYCYLISKADQPTRRLKAMEATDSGFKLAELDLRLRGPGEIYGSLQHGALDLNIASFSDTALIAAARKQVAAIVKNLEQDPAYLTNYQELSAGISHYQKLTILN
ncbi:DNA helicase RecG, partial [Candidatus Saccharibacteria bacterium]|nr:DNA helicase RecG [Candidatus Saccharibacteria bacterium]